MPTVPWDNPEYFKPVFMSHFNDGGPSKSLLVSDFAPILDEYDIRDFHYPTCYWLSNEDPFNFYWELVYQINQSDILPQDRYLASCIAETDNVGAHPFDRRPLPQVLGIRKNVSVYFNNKLYGVMLYKQTYLHDTNIDRYGSCNQWIGNHSDEVLQESGSSHCKTNKAGQRPSCMNHGCSFTVQQDTTFIRQAEDPSQKRLSLPEQTGPSLKVVKAARTIARQLTKQPGPGLATYHWETETMPGGRWHENFSPSLAIHKMRVFLRRGGLISYLRPESIEYSIPSGMVNSCDTSSTQFNKDYDLLKNCEYQGARALTPTYYHAIPNEKLSWRFHFNRDPREIGIDETGHDVTVPSGELFVEFVLVGDTARSSEKTLYTSPGMLDFGRVIMNFTLTNDIVIHNTSPTDDLDIQSVRLEGSDTTGFTYSLPVGMTLPSTLRPNSGFIVRVTAQPTTNTPYEVEAKLVIVGRKAGSNTDLTSQTVLRYQKLSGSEIKTLPDTIVFQRNLSPAAPPSAGSQYVKSFVILNYGSHPFTREPIQIIVRQPSLIRPKAFHFHASSSPDWNLPSTIQATQSEHFILEYLPTNPGEDTAEVVIRSDANNTNETRIRLFGRSY